MGSGAFLHRFEAPNGLTIIVKENHSTPIVSLATYFRGGLRAESEDNQGISHLSQRLLMKGTRFRTAEETASELEFVGASMAPFTGKDVFGSTLTSLSKHFAPALQIYADCLLNPVFRPDEVHKERANILAEIAKKKDDSLSWCLELCESSLYKKHPYRFPIQGREETLARLGSEDLAAWHHRFFSPDQMVVAVVGDMPARLARDLVLEAFEDFHPRNGKLPRTPREPAIKRVRSVEDRRDRRQVAVALGYHAPALGDDDYYAFDVLDHVLSGMGSRLFIELRDKQGLAYVVNCHFEGRRDMGSFKIYIGTSEDRRDRSRQAMLEELQKLKDRPVTRTELQRTKRYMLGMYEISLQRNGAQASRLAFYEIMGLGHRLLDEVPRHIRAVTSQQVIEAARRWLPDEGYALAQVLS